jgi:flavin reductase (NADH)
MAIDKQDFRQLFGTVPTAVGVVTTVDEHGAPRGMTCNAVCAVSMTPPLLLVCVDRTSRTLPALRRRAAFVVNFLAAGRDQLSNRFAGKDDDKFRAVRWVPAAAALEAPVLVDDVIAHAECRLTQMVPAGDHWLLIGQVEAAAVYDRPPLIYHLRSYAPWPVGPTGLRTP